MPARRLLFALCVLLAVAGCVAPVGPLPGERGPASLGKGDASAGPSSALLVVPGYAHSEAQRRDSRWALTNARRIASDLQARDVTVELLQVDSLDQLTARLDEMIAAGAQVGSFVILGHANQRGMFFDNPAGLGDREWLQAGWDWNGPGAPLDVALGEGIASEEGLMQLTDRLSEVVHPEGSIILAGCRTGRSRRASLRDVAQAVPKALPPTPFVSLTDRTPHDSFAHAVAELTGRVTYGSQIRDDLGRAPEKVRTIFFGGASGHGAVPRWWVQAVPTGGVAKADGTVLEGGVRYGEGCETYEACAAADDPAFDSTEGG